jgi:anti-anti-sigma factor
MAEDPLLHIDTSRDGDSNATVLVTGELDLSNCGQLERCMRGLIGDGCQRLIVDLEGLRFVDSTGLSVFVAIHKELQASGGTLQVQRPQPAVLKVMELTGLTTILAGQESV